MNFTLFILFLLLGVLFLWVARTVVVDFWSRRFKVPVETPWLPDYWHLRSLAAAVIFFILAGVMGYQLVKESRAPSELAQFIPVYPQLSGTTVVPGAGADQRWLFTSEDSPADIARFYQTLAAESDWSVVRSGDEDGIWLKMARQDTQVLLFVHRDGKQSKLMYRIGKPAQN